MPAAAGKLDEMFGRKASDFDPIGDESALVIVRRLFEKVDSVAAQEAPAAYHSLYQRVLERIRGCAATIHGIFGLLIKAASVLPLPPTAPGYSAGPPRRSSGFSEKPGVLRLFARILRDVWEPNEDIHLSLPVRSTGPVLASRPISCSG